MTIYQVSSGMYVKQLNPLELTSIEEEAGDFTDGEIDGIITDLEYSEGVEFAKGRPKDRQPK